MDWSNPIGAGISGLFSLAGSAVQYNYSKKLAEQQNQFNIDMWNRQNEYNSPAAQMKRFSEAGLNPNLIYGQGNAGNASSAPEMVTPNAPELSRGMRELAQAFNIEGLRTAIANRKKAEADARIALNTAYVNEEETKGIDALADSSGRLRYDPRTGMLSYLMPYGDSTGDYIYNKHMSGVAYSTALKFLSDNFRTNSLLYPRYGLISSQQSLNAARQGLLAPQISMANYQAKYFPWTFWLGNARTGVQAVSDVIPLPGKFVRPAMRYVSKYSR